MSDSSFESFVEVQLARAEEITELTVCTEYLDEITYLVGRLRQLIETNQGNSIETWELLARLHDACYRLQKGLFTNEK
ncbi:hypothetical protein [Amycolatopsis thermoflava]|uniref:hypothetical protein n=1 Tax=Amycolatopsis thermoflava TaxID=84480 RepID=UPI003EBB00B6